MNNQSGGAETDAMMQPTMTMTQFIKYLQRYCAERHSESPLNLSMDHIRSEAFGEMRRLIDIFLLEYAEQKALTAKGQKEYINTIIGDRRRQFDDPIELIRHIDKIASRSAPIFDSERISLAAIQGFCNDYLHNQKGK